MSLAVFAVIALLLHGASYLQVVQDALVEQSGQFPLKEWYAGKKISGNLQQFVQFMNENKI